MKTTIQRIACCAELAEPGWRFLADKMPGADVGGRRREWSFDSASPVNGLERLITRPKLSRYRAAARMAWRARHADVVISHLPRMTWWVAIFCKLFSARARHLAFSFNFTDLPVGRARQHMARAFRRVDRFVVFSEFEKPLYAEYFGLDPARIDVLPWTMERPVAEPDNPLVPGDYICAIGGEGRDYRTLIEASRAQPDIPLVVVARPHNLAGLSLPAHVQIFTNLNNPEFWNIVKFSKFVVIPLRDETTPCGHISIVGSLWYGKPIVSTCSKATREYLTDGVNALIGTPGDAGSLEKRIRQLWDDPSLRAQLGETAAKMAAQRHDERLWVEYLENFLAHK